MASHLAVPESGRPGLTRLRSSSSPSSPNTIEAEEKDQNTKRPSRPMHTRSRSYISPTEQKPTSAATFPSVASEKPAETSRFSRLHLPGRHHHHSASHEEPKQRGRGRHRYTQSEAQQYHKKRDSALINSETSGTPIITTTPADSYPEASQDLLSPTGRGPAIPSLMRMASTRSAYRHTMSNDIPAADVRLALRRRATSDPRSPTQEISQPQLRPVAPKTRIELDLERADKIRRALYDSTTEADLKRKDAQLTTATAELQDRFTTSTRSASDLMRRLDDAHDSLVRTTESLVDTISSFSNLSDESSKLIENFEHESQHLDHEIRQRISRFRKTLTSKRSTRVEELEKRGRTASKKAEEFSRRLENCRTIVRNWEEREKNKRKAWRGVWVGCIWGMVLIAVAVVAGIASWKVMEVNRGNGTATALLAQRTISNRSYDIVALEQLSVPDDVKEVLIDIDTRARKGYKLERPIVEPKVGAKANEDRGFRLLDEL